MNHYYNTLILQGHFFLTTDASNEALDAILSQGPTGQDLPISYANRTLSNPEKNYSTSEKELLTIVWSFKQYRPYLYGRKFTIVTDHKTLTWVFQCEGSEFKTAQMETEAIGI